MRTGSNGCLNTCSAATARRVCAYLRKESRVKKADAPAAVMQRLPAIIAADCQRSAVMGQGAISAARECRNGNTVAGVALELHENIDEDKRPEHSVCLEIRI
jgi:hypothetical protein